MKTVLLLIAFVLGATQVAEAQQAKKVPIVGMLTGGSVSNSDSRFAAFQQGLRDLGYIEGKT